MPNLIPTLADLQHMAATIVAVVFCAAVLGTFFGFVGWIADRLTDAADRQHALASLRAAQREMARQAAQQGGRR